MHVVIINHYYPPDGAPTGVMLEVIAKRMRKDGHTLTVFCALGGYSAGTVVEQVSPQVGAAAAGIRIVRVGATRFGRSRFVGKLLDYVSFYLGVAWKLLILRPRPDRIVALTTPPYLSVLARMLSKLRRADHAHWVMDLYPDVMVAHGMLRDRSLFQRGLAALACWGFGGRRCAAVVTLGPDMAESVNSYLPNDRGSKWVPLWATSQPDDDCDAKEAARVWRKRRRWSENEVVFLYSGNMGLGHRFGEFLEMARGVGGASGGQSRQGADRNFDDVEMRLVFSGGGKRRGEIEAYLKAHSDAAVPVELLDYVANPDLATHLLSADVHLASLEPCWDGTMVPSKLQGSFAVGRPVLFVGTKTCAIGGWIIRSEGGWVVAPGDLSALRRAIVEACDREERQRRGANAKRFSKEQFDREINAANVAKLLTQGQ